MLLMIGLLSQVDLQLNTSDHANFIEGTSVIAEHSRYSHQIFFKAFERIVV